LFVIAQLEAAAVYESRSKMQFANAWQLALAVILYTALTC